jgi:hypothetical protein
MCGSLPETQMLALWSSHRRRMIYSVQVDGTRPFDHGTKTTAAYWLAAAVLVVLLLSLSGCVVAPDRHGYYGGYYARPGYHSHGHHGYANRPWSYDGYRGNGRWNSRRDDD